MSKIRDGVTIKIRLETREMLKSIGGKGETYDDIILRLRSNKFEDLIELIKNQTLKWGEFTIHDTDPLSFTATLTDDRHKLNAIQGIAFDPENVDDPQVGEAKALREIRELFGDDATKEET